jgi:hypothetical protein
LDFNELRVRQLMLQVVAFCKHFWQRIEGSTVQVQWLHQHVHKIHVGFNVLTLMLSDLIIQIVINADIINLQLIHCRYHLKHVVK